jgi:isoleucyl-tRNA synthetase
LYSCLEVVAKLSAPIAPFFTDRLFTDLNNVTGREDVISVHLSNFPIADETLINKDLEERMQLAQTISSMVLSLRKKVNIRVRQPLAKIMIPILDQHFQDQVEAVRSLILSEVNVKEIEYLTDGAGILVKKIKPNFKTLGPRYGKLMKQIAAVVASFNQADIADLEHSGVRKLQIEGEEVKLLLSDVDIMAEDIPGWVVASEDAVTVALDITITPTLKEEGVARELINRIQNIRKEKNFEVTDKIELTIEKIDEIDSAIQNNFSYICSETLADSLDLVDKLENPDKIAVELTEELSTYILINRK